MDNEKDTMSNNMNTNETSTNSTLNDDINNPVIEQDINNQPEENDEPESNNNPEQNSELNDTNENEENKKKRLLPLIWLLLLVLLFVWGLAGIIYYSNAHKIPAKNVPVYLLDSVGITHSESDTTGEIKGYSSFQSTPDVEWNNAVTGSKQDCLITNPVGNPILVAPHVYIDMNKDTQIDENECVFNPKKVVDNKIEDYGRFLNPGQQIDKITLTQNVPKGEYDAVVSYDAIKQDTHTPANGMNMHFKVTVN